MFITIILATAVGVAAAVYSLSRSDQADLLSLLGLSTIYSLGTIQIFAFWVYHFQSSPWSHGILWGLLVVILIWLARHTDHKRLIAQLRQSFSWPLLLTALIMLMAALLSKCLIYADMPSPRGDDVKRHASLVYLLNHLDSVPTADQMEGYVWDLYPAIGFHVLLAALNDVPNLPPPDLIRYFVVLLPPLLALATYTLCRRIFNPTTATLGLALVLFFTQIPNEILNHSNYVFFLGMIYATAFLGTLITYLRDRQSAELPSMVISLTGLFTSGSFVQEFLLAAPALAFLFLTLRPPKRQTLFTLTLVVVAVALLGWPEIAYFYQTGRLDPGTDTQAAIYLLGIYGPVVGGLEQLPSHYGYLTSLLLLLGIFWTAWSVFTRKHRSAPSQTIAQGLVLWMAFALGFAILSSTYYIPLPGIFYSRGYKLMYSALLPIVALAAQGGTVVLETLGRLLPRSIHPIGVALLILISLAYGLYTDVRFWYPTRLEPILHPNGHRILKWMNTHLEDGDLVLNNFLAADTSSWIPAFTGNRAVIVSKGDIYPNEALKEELRYNVATNPNSYRTLELLKTLDVSYVYVGGHRNTLAYEMEIPTFNPAELTASPYYQLVAQDGNNFLFATQQADVVPEGYVESAQFYDGHRNPIFHWLTRAHFASIHSDSTLISTDSIARYDIQIQAGPRGGPCVLKVRIADATASRSKTLHGFYVKELDLPPFGRTDVQVLWDYQARAVAFAIDGHVSPPDEAHIGTYDTGFEYVVEFGLAESVEVPPFDQYEMYTYIWEDFTRPTSLPSDVEHKLAANLGSQVTLAGYDLSKAAIRAGETISVTLYWQARTKMDRGYTVFVHLYDPQNAHIWGQYDAQPHDGTYPTDWWIENEVVADTISFQVNPETPPGTYQLLVGMYWLPTGERLPLVDAAGDSVLLTTVQVTAD